MGEKYIEKKVKLYVAFTDLKKAHDKVDKRAIWEMLKIDGVGDKLLAAAKAFYENN